MVIKVSNVKNVSCATVGASRIDNKPTGDIWVLTALGKKVDLSQLAVSNLITSYAHPFYRLYAIRFERSTEYLVRISKVLILHIRQVHVRRCRSLSQSHRPKGPLPITILDYVKAQQDDLQNERHNAQRGHCLLR